jgi:NADH-quinone oxidoreductase subunit L
MTVPLMILAAGSILAGFLGVPHALGGSNRFEKFLEPVFANHAVVEHTASAEAAPVAVPEHSVAPAGHGAAAVAPAGHGSGQHETPATEPAKPLAASAHAAEKHEEHGSSTAEYLLMGLSVLAACAGLWGARKAYGRAGEGLKPARAGDPMPAVREPINALSPPLYRTLLNKYYVDELYDYLFTGRRTLGPVRLGMQGLGNALWKFDANVVDGGVNGAGWLTRFTATLSDWWDKWIIDGVGVNGPAIVTRALSYPVRLLEWGLVQWYALVMVIGVAGFIWYYVVR